MVLGAKNSGATFSGKNGKIPHSERFLVKYLQALFTEQPQPQLLLLHKHRRGVLRLMKVIGNMLRMVRHL